MRFLKKKINLKNDFLDELYDSEPEFETKQESMSSTDSENNCSQNTEASVSSAVQEFPLLSRKPRQKPTCPEGNSKNIIKNYGKALCSFASSDLAEPYVRSVIEKKGYSHISSQAFMQLMGTKKSQINSIESIRGLLVIESNDDEISRAYKTIFQEVSIIFLKYFSVNWIFGGKIVHKQAHMKFRFKMLRRIQDPIHFTYLRTSMK